MTRNFFSKNNFLILIGVTLIFISGCSKDNEPDPSAPLPALILTNQSYGSDEKQKIDIFLPEGRNLENTPLLIYLHGGAWVDGSKEEFLQFKPLMELSFPGFAFASIDYRLFDFVSKSNPFPTQENDVIEAINFLKSQFMDWSIEGEITLAGASAGGHLALLHSYKHPTIGPIHSAIAFFPPTNLVELHSFNNLTAQGLEMILNGSPNSNPVNYHQSSPLTFINSQTVPTIFFHGTLDQVVPISQSEELDQLLSEKNIPHQFLVIENQGHGFTSETYPALIQAAANFINQQK